MVGCDCKWTFPEDDAPTAAPAANVLASAVAGDNDAPPPPPPATVDPHDFLRWDMLNLDAIPIAEQKFETENIKSRRSVHAALIIIFLSDAVERAHPDVAAALHAGFQKVLERPVEFGDLRRYPSIGPNAYTVEEVHWCNGTIDYLEGLLDEEGRAKRALPALKRRRGPAAPAPAAPSKPPLARRTIPAVTKGDNETENDDDEPLVGQRHKRNKCKAR